MLRPTRRHEAKLRQLALHEMLLIQGRPILPHTYLKEHDMRASKGHLALIGANVAEYGGDDERVNRFNPAPAALENYPLLSSHEKIMRACLDGATSVEDEELQTWLENLYKKPCLAFDEVRVAYSDSTEHHFPPPDAERAREWLRIGSALADRVGDDALMDCWTTYILPMSGVEVRCTLRIPKPTNSLYDIFCVDTYVRSLLNEHFFYGRHGGFYGAAEVPDAVFAKIKSRKEAIESAAQRKIEAIEAKEALKRATALERAARPTPSTPGEEEEGVAEAE